MSSQNEIRQHIAHTTFTMRAVGEVQEVEVPDGDRLRVAFIDGCENIVSWAGWQITDRPPLKIKVIMFPLGCTISFDRYKVLKFLCAYPTPEDMYFLFQDLSR